MGSIAKVMNIVNEILSGVKFFISTSTQAVKLKFGHNAFSKKAAYTLQIRIQF